MRKTAWPCRASNATGTQQGWPPQRRDHYLISQRGGVHAHELPLRRQPPHLLPAQATQAVEEEQDHPWAPGRRALGHEGSTQPLQRRSIAACIPSAPGTHFSAPAHMTTGRCSSPLVPTRLSCLTSALPSLPVPSAASAGCTIGLQGPPWQPTLTRVEATSQGRPRLVVFPQVAQIPVTLVLHQPNHLLV